MIKYSKPLIINGNKVSKNIISKLKGEILKNNYKINFTSIIVGNNPDSEKYVKIKNDVCNKIGINNNILHLNNNISEKSLLSRVDKLNKDPNIHSILIQSPLPSHINSYNVLSNINFKKDPDCFNSYNIGNLSYLNYDVMPCTPKGILKLFNSYNLDYKNKNVTIIGTSNIVGKPLGIILSNSGATVTMCNKSTKNIKYYTKNSDIIISAAGSKHLINSSYIGNNFPVIIDVGINVDNNKLYGDVDFNDVKNKVSAITPVPGGVGPMTVSMLMNNIINLYKKFWS